MADYAPSASTALFQESAQQLMRRLEQDGSLEARSMARTAQELVEVFEAWKTARPADDVRVSRIQQLFDLNRRAMEFLSTPAPSAAASSGRAR
jgi:hypothetical protein